MHVTKSQIIKYSVLPGIFPRLSELFTSGFAHVAYLMAVIFEAVRLLPQDHAYLRRENFGRYGIIRVIAAASNNLTFSYRNIDQIVVFMMLLAGIVMLLGQIFILFISFVFGQPVFASGLFSGMNMLGTPETGSDQDLAFMLLDQIFGVTKAGGTGFFGSCIGNPAAECYMMIDATEAVPSTGAFPWPFHQALHKMFQFYSMGIFFVGVMVIIYFITSIVAETAQTGTPFGQRMNKAWAPVRLILFLALLLPVGSGWGWSGNAAGTHGNGLNVAQIILMHVVRMSSNLATNSWIYYNTSLEEPEDRKAAITGDNGKIVAMPQMPENEVQKLIQFITVVHTCRVSYYYSHDEETRGDFLIDAYLIRPVLTANGFAPVTPGVDAQRAHALQLGAGGSDYRTALNFAARGDIIIRFGQLAPIGNDGNTNPDFNDYMGQVKPYCGEMAIPMVDTNEPGAFQIQEAYYSILRELWGDVQFLDRAMCMAKKYTAFTINDVAAGCDETFDAAFVSDRTKYYFDRYKDAINAGVEEQIINGFYHTEGDGLANFMKRGWAGAALWYNKIAKMNGAIIASSQNFPKVSRPPLLLAVLAKENVGQNSNVSGKDLYKRIMNDAGKINFVFEFPNKKDGEIVTAMVNALRDVSGSLNLNGDPHSSVTGDVFTDFVNMLLGSSGVFEMRKNRDAHPLAQLSALGRGLMDAVVRNTAISVGLQLGAGAGKFMDLFKGIQKEEISSFFTSLVAMTAGMAFILYYVLPFMPFLYFLFAVSGWVKSIFEAMVALPLWALSHLRIDGEGIMGPGAYNGYALILEIFLRPILILAGMLASLATFSSLVWVLSLIFGQITSNVGGHDYALDFSGGVSELALATSKINVFFFTAMYTIICYMMALSSFKLIDMVPKQLLRWMGISTPAFQESMKDPVGTLNSQVQRGSMLLTNQLRDRGSGLAELG